MSDKGTKHTQDRHSPISAPGLEAEVYSAITLLLPWKNPGAIHGFRLFLWIKKQFHNNLQKLTGHLQYARVLPLTTSDILTGGNNPGTKASTSPDAFQPVWLQPLALQGLPSAVPTVS